MIRAYWLRLALFGVAFGLLALVMSLMSPKRYEATIQILIDQQPPTVPMSMNSAEYATADLLAFSRPRPIQTQVQQLTSYGVLQQAGQLAAGQLGVSFNPVDQENEFHAANLFSKVFVDAEPSSDVITLRVYMSTTEKAAEVARQIYNAFDQSNQVNSKVLAGAAISKLQTQLGPVQRELGSIDRKIQALRQRMGTPDVSVQIQSDVNSLASLKNQRDQAIAEYAAASSRLTSLQAEIAAIPPTIDAQDTTTPNPALQDIERQLVAAKAERSTLLNDYMEDAIPVKQVNQRIKQLQADRSRMMARVEGPSTKQPNPVRQSLISSLAEARAAEAGAKSRLTAATQAVQAKEVAMVGIPAEQRTLSELDRRRMTLERQNQALSDQLDSLKTAESGRTAVTRLITEPFVKPEPVSPRPMGNTLTGIVAGLILGVISMFLSESKRQPIRTIAQMNSLAFEPVFRVIPELDAMRRGFTKRVHESFETLLLNFMNGGKRPYSLGVVGVTDGAGASYTSASLATAAIRHGYRVTVVEHDSKGPIKRLAERGQKVVAEAGDLLHIQDASDQKLVSTAESSLAVASDLVIHDFRPATEDAEYALQAAQLDEVIVLVRAGSTRSVDFMQVQQALKDAGCRQVSLVFTRSRDFTVVSESFDRTPVVTDFA